MADKSFDVSIVSTDAELYSGEATFLIAQTTVGELGVLASHEPLLGQLVPGGYVVIDEVDGQRRSAAVEGGFISVTGESVTVLAEAAEWADGVDITAERSAMENAEPGTDEYNHAHALVRAAEFLQKK